MALSTRIALALLALCALAVTAGFALDRPTRQVQNLAQEYVAAVQRKDIPSALATLAPEQRERWAEWVEHQGGNRYDLEALAVRSPPLLARLRGSPVEPTEVAITARITLENGERWPRPAVTVVRLVWIDGQPRFLEPPFHPPEAGD